MGHERCHEHMFVCSAERDVLFAFLYSPASSVQGRHWPYTATRIWATLEQYVLVPERPELLCSFSTQGEEGEIAAEHEHKSHEIKK